MLILVNKKMNVLYAWLVSSKYICRLKSYSRSPITSGSPLVDYTSKRFHENPGLLTANVKCLSQRKRKETYTYNDEKFRSFKAIMNLR